MAVGFSQSGGELGDVVDEERVVRVVKARRKAKHKIRPKDILFDIKVPPWR